MFKGDLITMSKTKKIFDRSVAFTFYKEWKQDADNIEEDFGAEVKAAYYDAIINYALFEIEPEMKAPIKYFWNSIKEKIDASQDNRSRSFREDIELTNKIIDYKAANPAASQRNIAEALGCSVGKVNKVLNTNTNTNTNTSTSTSTNTSMNVNMNTNVNTNVNTHAKDEEEREEKREIEDLEEKELEALKKDFKARMLYKDIAAKYNLKLVTKEMCDSIDELIKAKVAERQEAEQRKDAELAPVYSKLDTYLGGENVKRIIKSLNIDAITLLDFAEANPQYSFEYWNNDENNCKQGYHKENNVGEPVPNVTYEKYLLKGINAFCA